VNVVHCTLVSNATQSKTATNTIGQCVGVRLSVSMRQVESVCCCSTRWFSVAEAGLAIGIEPLPHAGFAIYGKLNSEFPI
jgi:hypothetical protein